MALLFVPGDRPERFAKATGPGAEVVLFELEDAVAPASKDAAREHVRAHLAAGHPGVVWIHGVGPVARGRPRDGRAGRVPGAAAGRRGAGRGRRGGRRPRSGAGLLPLGPSPGGRQ